MRTLTWTIMLTLSLAGCNLSLTGECSDEIKQEAKSPDGKYVATWYVRDCGATTSFSTIVNLRIGSARFNGNEGEVFVVKGQPQVKIAWNNESSLQVSCPECRSEDIFKRETLHNSISVSY